MKQTIHIFTKDVRRFSSEIALSLILLALYGWCQPVTWNPIDAIFMAQVNSWRYLGANVCGFLLILAWAALLIRLISEDSPTGDRQFWITRPYRWPSLLAAKVLFFIIVVNIPLFIVQLGLLQAAGFPPFHYLARLLAMQFFLAACYLCIAALAAVARGGRQFTRAAIVVLIFFVIVLWLGMSSDRAVGFDLDIHRSLDWIGETLLIALPAVVIVLQYARRRTAQSRWILLGGGFALVLLTAAQPASTLNEAEYPLLAPGTEPRLEVSLEPPLKSGTAALPIRSGESRGKTVLLRLPLRGADMPAGYLAQVNAVRVTLRAPDGTRWDSGWKSAYHLFPDADFPHDPAREAWRSLDTPLEVERNFFDHIKDTGVTVDVATAATLFRDHQGPALTPVDGQVTVPDFGYCVTEQRSSQALLCRTAQSEVPMMTFSRLVFKSCPPTTEDLAGSASERGAWIGQSYGNGFGLSPVKTVEFYFGDSEGKRLVSCPGAPFILHRAEMARQFRVENDFPNVRLADYIMQ